MVLYNICTLVRHVLVVWAVTCGLYDSYMCSTVSNSTCGINYPYGKCYAGYKVIRIYASDENSVETIETNILKKFDLDIWSHPSSIQNDTNVYFDIMVSPKDQERVYNTLQSSAINSMVLHTNVNDLIIQESRMASNQIFLKFEFNV